MGPTDVTLRVLAVEAADWKTVVSGTNKAATLILHVADDTFKGRFNSNLFYLPPHSTQELKFAFAESDAIGVPTKQEFEASLYVTGLTVVARLLDDAYDRTCPILLIS